MSPTVYIPRPIRTVEDAEGLPEGTIMFLPAGPYVWTARDPGGEFLDHYGRPWHFENTQDDEPSTALVPVEATEVYGARDKAGAVSRADAGTADPRAQLEKHITERRALGHTDTLVSRPVLPWEAVEEA